VITVSFDPQRAADLLYRSARRRGLTEEAAQRAAELPAPARPDCPGTGRLWGTGTGHPICPVCHRRARALGAAPQRKARRGWAGRVPAHEKRTP